MDKLKNDERFKDALTNPKYFKTNKKDKKVKLDKRFQRILTDKDFTLKYSVDSKGKPLKQSANEDLKKCVYLINFLVYFHLKIIFIKGTMNMKKRQIKKKFLK